MTNRERELNVNMTEVTGTPEPTTGETNRVVEIIGKDNARRIAAIGVAAVGLLGISGQPESGVGVGIEVPDPVTRKPVSVGLTVSSANVDIPLGMPKEIADKIADGPDALQAYQVRIGGMNLAVYTAKLTGQNPNAITILGVYPGFETLR